MLATAPHVHRAQAIRRPAEQPILADLYLRYLAALVRMEAHPALAPVYFTS
jgi:hypothetical protein